MYISPRKYKCIKCSHEFDFSPHDHHSAPVTLDRNPVCPKCWDNFLHTVGVGLSTDSFIKGGSDYDKHFEKMKKVDDLVFEIKQEIRNEVMKNDKLDIQKD